MAHIVRTQHPVGQGCFFSEIHEWDGIQSHLVYDCGSGKRGATHEVVREVLRFAAAAAASDRARSALVVSHFHADHVNGLGELLRRGVKFGSVYLPHLSAIERDVVFVGAAMDAPAAVPLLGPLVYDPASLFGGSAVRAVRGPGEDGTDMPEPPSDIGVPEEFRRGARTPPVVISDSDSVPFGGAPGASTRWVLRFFCRKRAEECKRLWAALAAIDGGGFPAGPARIVEWIDKHQAEIRNAYGNVLGTSPEGHNAVSMCCYSGPPEGPAPAFSIRVNGRPLRSFLRHRAWEGGTPLELFARLSSFFGAEAGWLGYGDLAVKKMGGLMDKSLWLFLPILGILERFNRSFLCAMDKTCPECGFPKAKKDGLRNGRRSWRCKACGHVFQNARRAAGNPGALLRAYGFRRQTAPDLAREAGVCARTVRRRLAAALLGFKKGISA